MAKITILGAGLAGLSAAYHLKKDYQIYEKNEEIGGLCRSNHIDGFTFDCSGHLLHFQTQKGFDFVHSLLGEELLKHKRRAWIYFKGAYIPYPFQANLYYLPQVLAHECLQGMLKRKKLGGDTPVNFSEWLIGKFGKGMVNHFFEPYNTKFWTLPLEEISYSWAENLVPVPTISEALEGAWKRNKKAFGYNINFWYPKKGGIKVLIDSLSKSICNIQASKEIKKIDWEAKKVKFNDGEEVEYESLISTLPLVELIDFLDNAPEEIVASRELLQYVSIYNLNLGIDRERITDKHWIYFPEKDFIFFRVGFPMNFSKEAAPSGKSSLYTEVSYSSKRPLDNENIKARIIEDLHKAKILRGKDKILAVDENDIRYGYILCDHNYQSSQMKILNFLNSIKIFPIGRYGRWHYMSMEQVILDGRRIAEMLN